MITITGYFYLVTFSKRDFEMSSHYTDDNIKPMKKIKLMMTLTSDKRLSLYLEC